MADSNIQIKFATKTKYEEARERICRFNPEYKNCSDKEIIECLANEIDYYRKKIDNLAQINKENIKLLEEKDNKIEELEQREICSTTETLKVGVDIGDKDYTVTRWYEDGCLIKEEIQPSK